jgi:integrase
MSRRLILPQLVGKNLNDQWYVEFSVYDERAGKMIRFRKSKGFSKFNTVREKRSYGLKQVVYWEARLRDLKYDPFENNVVIISDDLQYKINSRRIKDSKYNTSYYLNEFFQERQSELRPKTVSTYKAKARIFLSWLENNSLLELHPKLITADTARSFSSYLTRQRQVHNKSHNAYTQTLYTIWEFLRNKKVVIENIWKDVPKKRYYSQSQKPFTPAQSEKIREFLSISNPWLLFFCEFQYHTLVRPCSEQTQLKVSDIDYHMQELIVRGEISKNKKTQRVAIPNQLMERIREFKIIEYPGDYFIFGRFCPSPDPVSKDHFSKQFRSVLTTLGIGHEWSMYSWKHTMNQRAAMNGVPVKELQMQNRHHSLDQMDAYLKGLTVSDARHLFENIPNM